MKRYFKIIVLLLLAPALAGAQQNKPDSLKHALALAKTDSARYFILVSLSDYYAEGNRENSNRYAEQALFLARKNDKKLNEAEDLMGEGYEMIHLKKYPQALQYLQQAQQISEDPANEDNGWIQDKTLNHIYRRNILANVHHIKGHLMGATRNTDEQIIEYREAGKLAKEVGDKTLLGLVNMNLGHTYYLQNRLDSALILAMAADRYFKAAKFYNYVGTNYKNIGEVYLKQGKNNIALQYFHKSIISNIQQNNIQSLSGSYNDLANYYLSAKQKDSSLFYAKRSLAVLNSIGSKDLAKAYENIYKSYKLNMNIDSAYKYQGLALIAVDSSYNNDTKSLGDFQQLSIKTQLRLQQLEKEKADAQTRVRYYVLLAGIGLLVLLSVIFYRNNRLQKKANLETQRALANLKTTQTQLIQSEKMASLGELTAGIAHEIQNPLNFINNFSEVNKEMVDELEEELKNGNIEEALAITADIKANEEKINHHGKRADFIVKGMLQHSRTSTGEKQLTNINVLADEFLKLSYHGLRAKDKSFNAELVTNFDEQLPKVNIAQQDIGRVLLNLFNNAFYAVNQKAKTAGEDYKPTVTVTTFAPPSGGWGAKVRDNGNGIPDNIKDKIMQPFFTTKPTGEGTGLGLSLSYDIVVKGHGGKVSVDTKENEFTEFTVWMPIA